MYFLNNRKEELIKNLEKQITIYDYYMSNWTTVTLDSLGFLKELFQMLQETGENLQSDEKSRLEKVIPVKHIKKLSKPVWMGDLDGVLTSHMAVGLFYLLIENEESSEKHFNFVLSLAPLSYEASYYKSNIKSLSLEERRRYAYFSTILPSPLYYHNLFMLLFEPTKPLLDVQNKQCLIFLKQEIERDKKCDLPNIYCIYIEILFKLLMQSKSLGYFDGFLVTELYLREEALKFVEILLRVDVRDRLSAHNLGLYNSWLSKFNFTTKFNYDKNTCNSNYNKDNINYEDEWRRMGENEMDNDSNGFWRWNVD